MPIYGSCLQSRERCSITWSDLVSKLTVQVGTPDHVITFEMSRIITHFHASSSIWLPHCSSTRTVVRQLKFNWNQLLSNFCVCRTALRPRNRFPGFAMYVASELKPGIAIWPRNRGLGGGVEVDGAGPLLAAVLRASPGRAAVGSNSVLPLVVSEAISVEELSGTALSGEELAECDHNEYINN